MSAHARDTRRKGLPLTAADLDGQRSYDWHPLHVRWADVLRYQHWGGLLIFVPAVVLTAVSHWTFQQRPVERPAIVYDATISYPTDSHQTIPNSLAVLYNWLCLIVAVVLVELLLFRRQHSLTAGLTGMIHQAWCCAINFVVILAIAEITKPFSGRLRPDFLARCQPAALGTNRTAGDVFRSTLSPDAGTLGPVHLGQVANDCTNPDLDTVRDGRLSFPSGHASNSMSVAWYTTFYVIWSMYLRHNAPYPATHRAGLRPNLRRKHAGLLHYIGRRILQELWHALVYAFVLLTLCLSWFIGMTRFWDNVHNISDILGGFLVAIIFTTPFAIKAIGLHTCINHLIDEDPAAGADAAASNGAPTAAGSSILPVTMQDSNMPVVGQRGPGGGELQHSHTALDVGHHPAGP